MEYIWHARCIPESIYKSYNGIGANKKERTMRLKTACYADISIAEMARFVRRR